jgi:hypothetical protein
MGVIMSKFSVDYSGLENQLIKKAYRLNDVKDKVEKVAFDIVRFKDGDKAADLWQIHSTEDGDYIIALYQDSEEKTASCWDVLLSKNGSDLQISYKGDPLIKLSASQLGIPNFELDKVEQYLPKKLSENKKLVKALLNQLSSTAKEQVLGKYPELL